LKSELIITTQNKKRMTHLKAGGKAPDFSGLNQDGEQISLSDFAGKKLVLYFYPKDDTPGCTAEACSLRDNFELLKNSNYQVLGVSADTVAKHKKFIEKYELPFPLLADIDKEVIKAYGCWGEKKFMGKVYDGIHRITFVIDENGIIESVIDKVKTKAHAEQILG
jgi:peroxiredoxin Q/BCP